MLTTKCPVCESDVVIEDDAFENDLVDCLNCGRELEIISLRPLTLEEVGDQQDGGDEDALEDEDGEKDKVGGEE